MYQRVEEPIDSKRERWSYFYQGWDDRRNGRMKSPPVYASWRFREQYFQGYKAADREP